MADEDAPVLKYIHEAAKRGHADQIIEYLETNPNHVDDRDSLQNTPLLWAAGAGHYDAVVVLVNKGADVNAVNKHLDTPLHRAAWKNEAKICEFLISKGASKSRTMKNKDGKTPLELSRNLATRRVVAVPTAMDEKDRQYENSGEDSD